MNLKTRGEYKQAMIEYGLRTCVQFKDWEGESDYLSIYPLSGCWSYVGQGQGSHAEFLLPRISWLRIFDRNW